ncbi:methionyl-tRNA formyltransferase [Succiniclasticum ruminis]|uniref:Methionyl-tRNA formyltransferase n=1 Tax=Succiniclasticum ruminis TaxID=40841 RepID=A0A1G6JFI0_9FIRM|nr:methionyl-tRNA formyltransferase [Succiniclasticum ruminis]SDC16676.1 methionyl-tRNA formyltransferase [Succiniclasticum ruminis]
MWNVVFMGTPDFAVGSLKVLLEAGQYHIQAVVTQPDRPKGRGQKMVETPVKTFALQHGLPVFQPLKVKEAEFVQQLKAWQPDFIVVAAFGQFLTQEILDIPTYGCINVHASLLPKYRGAAPIQYAIIKGEKESGVTIMRMEKGMDTGAMYSRVVVPIDAEMNFARLHDELMEKGAELLTDTLPRIAEGLQPEIQKESEATFATLLTKEMAKIDWNRPAQEVHDRVRGFDPVPGAFTYLPDGKLLKIWETRVTGNRTEALPGTVVSVTKKDFSVACRDGELRILTVQPESKKRMPAAVFLNGRGVTAGDRFGSKE